ncbi:MAG TPA: hypothetical protein VN625_02535 [Desulfuromonadaceae bacterium]|nr:hypothetical protein [Desulfuromonadaceae bacterium]
MNYFNRFIPALTIVAAVALAGCSKGSTPPAADKAPESPVTTATNAAAAVKPYPLKTCIVSGEKLGGDMGEPVTFVYQDQEIKFCCAMCKPKFLNDPNTFLKKINEAAAGAKN